jgi:hypothetical protein
MADEKASKEKEAEAAAKKTKHHVPDGFITPVQATHKLKKEINPKTDEPYAPSSLSSQQVYTLSRTAETNKMPVLHFTEDGKHHKTRQTDGDGNVTTRPGFKWEDLAEWWANRPARKTKEASEDKEEKTDNASDEESEEDELSDELDEDDEEGALVEAE